MTTLAPSFSIGTFSFLQEKNKGIHKSLDEFEFQPDPATDYGVTCPCVSKKSMYNVVNILAPPFFIRSSSFLQVTRTSIKFQMS